MTGYRALRVLPVLLAGLLVKIGGAETIDLALDLEALEISRGLGTLEFGVSMASGDFDGDGVDELVVGEPGNPLTPEAPGRVHLFKGGDAFLVGPYRDLSAQPADWTVFGESAGAGTGFSLACLDFDKDGDLDLAIGAPGADRVYLLFGPFTAEESTIDLELGTADVTISATAGTELGRALAAGDFNGDGWDDLMIAAPGASPKGRLGAGVVFVLSADDRYIETDSMNLGAEPADGTILGELAGESLGFSLASGDFDGDGIDDLFAGAPDYSAGGKSQIGAAYLLLGNAAEGSGKKVDLAAGAGDLRIYGEGAENGYGESVAMGDVNGDGRDDLLSGAPFASGEGASRQFSGKAYGFFGIPDFQGPEEISLSLKTADVEIVGPAFTSNLGTRVALVDVDQDGMANIVCAGRRNGGDVYVLRDVFSSGGAVDLGRSSAQVNLIHSGVSQDPPYGAGLGRGDFDGDGFVDLMVNSYDGGGTVHLLRGFPDGDLNQNGLCDVADLLLFRRTLGKEGAGDYNRNGAVDSADLRLFLFSWKRENGLLFAQ